MLVKAEVTFPDWEEDGYTSVEEQIVRQAADLLVEQITEKTLQETREAVMKTIRAKVGEIVEAAILEPIQIRDRWGEAIGKVKTMRDLMIEEAGKYLQETVDRDGRKTSRVSDAKFSRAEYFARIAATEYIEQAFKAAVKEAAAEVKAQVDARMAPVLEQAVKDILAGK